MTRHIAEKRGLGYWALLAVFIAGAFLAANLVTAMRSSGPHYLTSPQSQQSQIKVRELLIEASREERSDSSHSKRSKLDAIRLELAPDGNLFVIEQSPSGHEALRELSPSGLLINNLSDLGSPEIKSFTDLAFDQHYVWIADLLGSSVHRLDRRTFSWSSTRHASEPYRLEVSHSQLGRLVIMRIGASSLFDITDFRGNITDSFGKLIVNQKHDSLLLDGFIARCGSSIVFAGKHLGLLASYSDSGRLRYAVRSINSPTKPILLQDGDKRWIHPNAIQASRSISGNETHFGVLVSRSRNLEVRSFIDLYWTANGHYYKSLMLPPKERWTSLAVGKDFLYTASNQRIVRWPRAVLSEGGQGDALSTGRILLSMAQD